MPDYHYLETMRQPDYERTGHATGTGASATFTHTTDENTEVAR
ncbi:hypothetical protein ACFQH6_12175 [Halobacteriaceae archaeon GCM10025711]